MLSVYDMNRKWGTEGTRGFSFKQQPLQYTLYTSNEGIIWSTEHRVMLPTDADRKCYHCRLADSFYLLYYTRVFTSAWEDFNDFFFFVFEWCHKYTLDWIGLFVNFATYTHLLTRAHIHKFVRFVADWYIIYKNIIENYHLWIYYMPQSRNFMLLPCKKRKRK